MTVTKTTAEVAANNMRQVMALYYAFGRADAEPGIVDVARFAEFYMARWEEFQNGSCSFMPSVQDCFDTYRRTNREVGGGRS